MNSINSSTMISLYPPHDLMQWSLISHMLYLSLPLWQSNIWFFLSQVTLQHVKNYCWQIPVKIHPIQPLWATWNINQNLNEVCQSLNRSTFKATSLIRWFLTTSKSPAQTWFLITWISVKINPTNDLLLQHIIPWYCH